jgi:hypothetical protein
MAVAEVRHLIAALLNGEHPEHGLKIAVVVGERPVAVVVLAVR